MNPLFHRRYGLYGERNRDFLTYQGRILVHTDRAEMEFLFPIAKNGSTTVRELPSDVPHDQTMPIREHPEMGFVRWTDGRLDRSQFRRSAM